MRKLLLALLLLPGLVRADHGRNVLEWPNGPFKPFVYYSGAKYTYSNHSNTLIADGNITFTGTVQHGDTCIFTGAFTSMPDLNHFTGLIGDSVVLDFTGSTWTSTGYTQTTWQNMSYVKVVGGKTLNYYYGNCTWSQYVYNIRVTGMNLTNAVGHYQNGQIAFQIGAGSGSPYTNMTYINNSQNLATTFHGVRFDNDTVIGFSNTTPIAIINDGAHNLMVSFEFDHNYSKMITSISPGTGITGGSPGLISGTILGYKIHDNVLDSFNVGLNACQCTHSEWMFIVGYGDVYNNYIHATYGSFVRAFPMTYPGILGFGYDPLNYVTEHDNYIQAQVGYSVFESNTTGVSGNLISLGFGFTRTACYNNTVDSTNIDVSNANHPTTKPFNPFEGAIMSIYADSVHVYNNLAIHMAMDTFPVGLYRSQAITNINGHTAGRDTAGNFACDWYIQAGVDSANLPNLLSTSRLKNAAVNKTPLSVMSYNQVVRSGLPYTVGAWEFPILPPTGPTIGVRKVVILKKSIKSH